MKWEVKELPDGRWGIFLCKKYWKFKDRPVMYSAAATVDSAQRRVDRMNDPGMYSYDERYISLGQVREQEKRRRAIARSVKKSKFTLQINKGVKDCVKNVQISITCGIIIL